MQSKIRLTAADKMEKAYFEMLETTHYTKISVSDIIERAGVSRTTFYRHFDDIFDMHKKIADNMCKGILRQAIAIISANEEKAYDKLAQIFKGQDRYIILISGENGSRYFFESLYKISIKHFLPFFSDLPDELIFRLKFIIGASISLYIKDILVGREHNMQFVDICKSIVDLNKILGGNYG